MVDIIKTPLRYFVTLDSTGAPISYQREYQQRIEDAGVEVVSPSIRVEDVDANTFSQVFDHASVTLTGKIAELNTLNSALQIQVTSLTSQPVDEGQ